LSQNPTSPNLIYFSKYQVFSSPMSHCLFTAFHISVLSKVRFCKVFSFLFLVLQIIARREPSFGSRPMRSLPFGEKMPQMPQRTTKRRISSAIVERSERF
jgi:hypothetical protein